MNKGHVRVCVDYETGCWPEHVKEQGERERDRKKEKVKDTKAG